MSHKQPSMFYTQEKIKKIHKFIDELFEPADFIAITCFTDEKATGKTKQKSPPVNFTGQKDIIKKKLNREFLEKMAENKMAVCVSPNPLKPKTTRSNKNIKKFNWLYVDIDKTEINIEQINPLPSIVTQRDKNKLHIYWKIDGLNNNSKNLKLFSRIETELIERLGADKAVKDPGRPLRLPYTYHGKNENDKEKEYRVVRVNKNKYKLKEIIKITIDREPDKEQTTVFKNSDDEIIKFLYGAYSSKDPIEEGDGRSRELYFVGVDCYKWGLSENTALEIGGWFNKKICAPSEELSVVKHQIHSAYKYTKSEAGEYRKTLQSAIKESERKDQFKNHRESQKLRTALKNSVYIKETEKLFDLIKGLSYTNTQIRTHLIEKFHTLKPLQYILFEGLIKVVEKEDFRPSIDKQFFTEKNIKYLNRFKSLNIERIEKKELETVDAQRVIKIFTYHLDYLATSPYEYNRLIDIFSHLIQNPGQKIPSAILITSKHQGIGKSILEILFRKIFGIYVGSFENSMLSSGYTEFIIDKILIFVHELYQGDKMATMNRLKNLITEGSIRINEKYVKSYEGTNAANFIMFSNRLDAIFADKYDRRLFVIRNEKAPQSQKYYERLVNAFENQYQTLYWFLYHRDISHFNPFERPGETEGKKQMIYQGLSELALFLSDLQNDPGESPFKHLIIRASDVVNYLEHTQAPKAVLKWAGSKNVIKFFIDEGYEQRTISYRSTSGLTKTGGSKKVNRKKRVKSVSVWSRCWDKIKTPAEIIKEIIEPDIEENKENVF